MFTAIDTLKLITQLVQAIFYTQYGYVKLLKCKLYPDLSEILSFVISKVKRLNSCDLLRRKTFSHNVYNHSQILKIYRIIDTHIESKKKKNQLQHIQTNITRHTYTDTDVKFPAKDNIASHRHGRVTYRI